MMHRIIVEEKRWISETRFLHALNYCMLLPGPEGQQRTLGDIIAGGLFVLPGLNRHHELLPISTGHST